jgi:replicative DNA helicase
MDDAKLLIDDKYGYDFDKIVSIVELIKPDFVFIDYIQMISMKGRKNKLEAIEEYIRRIKELSVEHNFGAIVVSQINRTGVEQAEMHHLKGAGVLEEHSDAVVFLNWSYEEANPNKYLIDVKKQRHGTTTPTPIEVDFLPQYSLFREKELRMPKNLLGD